MSHVHEHDDEEMVEYIRQAIDMIDSASKNEREKKLLYWDPNSELDKTVYCLQGELLDKCKNSALSLKSSHESSTSGETVYDKYVATTNAMFIPADRPDLKERVCVGGDKCDVCGKARSPDARLSVCTKCKLACYCSRECQVQAWKSGHKKACRKPDDIRIGDLMKALHMNEILGSDSKSGKDDNTSLYRSEDIPVLVQVVAKDEDNCVIKCLLEKETWTVPSKNLIHIRPEK